MSVAHQRHWALACCDSASHRPARGNNRLRACGATRARAIRRAAHMHTEPLRGAGDLLIYAPHFKLNSPELNMRLQIEFKVQKYQSNRRQTLNIKADMGYQA